jgi:hypothetical protein
MSIKRLFDAVERRGDIGRRVAALVLPIPNRPRVTSSCAGKIGLRQPTSGPNLASRDNVAHNPILYTILETPPPILSRTFPVAWEVVRMTQAGPRPSATTRGAHASRRLAREPDCVRRQLGPPDSPARSLHSLSRS